MANKKGVIVTPRKKAIPDGVDPLGDPTLPKKHGQFSPSDFEAATSRGMTLNPNSTAGLVAAGVQRENSALHSRGYDAPAIASLRKTYPAKVVKEYAYRPNLDQHPLETPETLKTAAAHWRNFKYNADRAAGVIGDGLAVDAQGVSQLAHGISDSPVGRGAAHAYNAAKKLDATHPGIHKFLTGDTPARQPDGTYRYAKTKLNQSSFDPLSVLGNGETPSVGFTDLIRGMGAVGSGFGGGLGTTLNNAQTNKNLFSGVGAAVKNNFVASLTGKGSTTPTMGKELISKMNWTDPVSGQVHSFAAPFEALSEMVFDPSNLLGLGEFGAGAKLFKAALAEGVKGTKTFADVQKGYAALSPVTKAGFKYAQLVNQYGPLQVGSRGLQTYHEYLSGNPDILLAAKKAIVSNNMSRYSRIQAGEKVAPIGEMGAGESEATYRAIRNYQSSRKADGSRIPGVGFENADHDTIADSIHGSNSKKIIRATRSKVGAAREVKPVVPSASADMKTSELGAEFQRLKDENKTVSDEDFNSQIDKHLDAAAEEEDPFASGNNGFGKFKPRTQPYIPYNPDEHGVHPYSYSDGTPRSFGVTIYDHSATGKVSTPYGDDYTFNGGINHSNIPENQGKISVAHAGNAAGTKNANLSAGGNLIALMVGDPRMHESSHEFKEFYKLWLDGSIKYEQTSSKPDRIEILKHLKDNFTQYLAKFPKDSISVAMRRVLAKIDTSNPNSLDSAFNEADTFEMRRHLVKTLGNPTDSARLKTPPLDTVSDMAKDPSLSKTPAGTVTGFTTPSSKNGYQTTAPLAGGVGHPGYSSVLGGGPFVPFGKSGGRDYGGFPITDILEHGSGRLPEYADLFKQGKLNESNLNRSMMMSPQIFTVPKDKLLKLGIPLAPELPKDNALNVAAGITPVDPAHAINNPQLPSSKDLVNKIKTGKFTVVSPNTLTKPSQAGKMLDAYREAGATLTPVRGSWNGKAEVAFMVEGLPDAKVDQIAKRFKQENVTRFDNGTSTSHWLRPDADGKVRPDEVTHNIILGEAAKDKPGFFSADSQSGLVHVSADHKNDPIPQTHTTEQAGDNPGEISGSDTASGAASPSAAPDSSAMAKSYDALKAGVKDQFDYLKRNGVNMQPWTKEGQPYANSHEMQADAADNNNLHFFQGGDMNANHPLAEVDKETGLSYNDMLRAVHDYFGHAAEGNQFGPHGEENAYMAHLGMFPPEAAAALTAETRAQNSFVNFGPHMRDAQGNLLKQGDTGYLGAADRPYAAQSAYAAPDKYIGGDFNTIGTPMRGQFPDNRPRALSDQYRSENGFPKNPEVSHRVNPNNAIPLADYHAAQPELPADFKPGGAVGKTDPFVTEFNALMANRKSLDLSTTKPTGNNGYYILPDGTIKDITGTSHDRIANTSAKNSGQTYPEGTTQGDITDANMAAVMKRIGAVRVRGFNGSFVADIGDQHLSPAQLSSLEKFGDAAGPNSVYSYNGKQAPLSNIRKDGTIQIGESGALGSGEGGHYWGSYNPNTTTNSAGFPENKILLADGAKLPVVQHELGHYFWQYMTPGEQAAAKKEIDKATPDEIAAARAGMKNPPAAGTPLDDRDYSELFASAAEKSEFGQAPGSKGLGATLKDFFVAPGVRLANSIRHKVGLPVALDNNPGLQSQILHLTQNNQLANPFHHERLSGKEYRDAVKTAATSPTATGDRTIKVPQTPEYGSLGGQYISPRDIALVNSHIKDHQFYLPFKHGKVRPVAGMEDGPTGEFEGKLPKTLTDLVRFGKDMQTRKSGNAGYYFHNMVGDNLQAITQSQFSGPGAIPYIKNIPSGFKEALAGSGPNTEGLMARTPVLQHSTTAGVLGDDGAANDVNKPGLAAQFEKWATAAENAPKITLYKTLTEGGMSADDAAEKVAQSQIDWGALPGPVKMLSASGLVPYANYGYAATKFMLETAAKNPVFLRRLGQLRQSQFNSYPGSQEQLQKGQDYQQNAGVIPTGFDPTNGAVNYKDFSPLLPGSVNGLGLPLPTSLPIPDSLSATSLENAAGKLVDSSLGALQDNVTQAPLVGGAARALMNRNRYGEDINPTNTPPEIAGRRDLAEVGSSLVPGAVNTTGQRIYDHLAGVPREQVGGSGTTNARINKRVETIPSLVQRWVGLPTTFETPDNPYGMDLGKAAAGLKIAKAKQKSEFRSGAVTKTTSDQVDAAQKALQAASDKYYKIAGDGSTGSGEDKSKVYPAAPQPPPAPAVAPAADQQQQDPNAQQY